MMMMMMMIVMSQNFNEYNTDIMQIFSVADVRRIIRNVDNVLTLATCF